MCSPGHKGHDDLTSSPVSYTHLDVYKRQVVNLVYSDVVAIRAFISPCSGLIPSAATAVNASIIAVSYTHLDVYKRQVGTAFAQPRNIVVKRGFAYLSETRLTELPCNSFHFTAEDVYKRQYQRIDGISYRLHKQ